MAERRFSSQILFFAVSFLLRYPFIVVVLHSLLHLGGCGFRTPSSYQAHSSKSSTVASLYRRRFLVASQPCLCLVEQLARIISFLFTLHLMFILIR